MKMLFWAALVLVVVGAINWGLVGLFNTDVVASVLGVGTTLTKAVYVLVGISGVWVVIDRLGNLSR